MAHPAVANFVPSAPESSTVAQLPSFPKVKTPRISNHHNRTNPQLSLHLLQDLQGKVQEWLHILQDLQGKIQTLYREGPMINGWLEFPEGKTQNQEANYQLCGLDRSGKRWAHLCPPADIAEVSLAIARYHQLKQLLEQKRVYERKLNNLAESLVHLHHHFE